MKRPRIEDVIDLYAAPEGDTEKAWISTDGMEALGLPELEMREVPIILVEEAAALMVALGQLISNRRGGRSPICAGETIRIEGMDAGVRFQEAEPFESDRDHDQIPVWEVRGVPPDGAWLKEAVDDDHR